MAAVKSGEMEGREEKREDKDDRGSVTKERKTKEVGHVYPISIVPAIDTLNTYAAAESSALRLTECGAVH